MVVYLIPLLATLAVFVGLVGVRFLLPRRERVSERLHEIRGEVDVINAGPSLTERPLPAFLQAISTVGWLLPPMSQSETLQWELAEAGFRRPGTSHLFVAAKILLAVLFGTVMLLTGLTLAAPRDRLAIATIAALALGFYLPNMWLSRRRGARREIIRLALPDALDLMVVCVEAGQGLNAAILTVGREMTIHAPPLSQELRLISNEIRAGLTRAQSLRNFATRTGIDEARALVAVLVQSDRLGTSIAQALRVHAQGMRTRRRQRAEEAARKTAVKLLFPLIFCIFPELLVVILAPAMIQVVRALTSTAAG